MLLPLSEEMLHVESHAKTDHPEIATEQCHVQHLDLAMESGTERTREKLVKQLVVGVDVTVYW
jgi:hypothetical protein